MVYEVGSEGSSSYYNQFLRTDQVSDAPAPSSDPQITDSEKSDLKIEIEYLDDKAAHLEEEKANLNCNPYNPNDENRARFNEINDELRVINQMKSTIEKVMKGSYRKE